MCGIVGAIAERNVVPVLMEGLRRLEYRGYDSAGIAVRVDDGHIQRIRSVGKVGELQARLDAEPLTGRLGIAHTRWATHGIPAERNAHPHMSGERVAVVHNGIIENHAELRAELSEAGYRFTSETDTEVIAHLLASHLEESPDLLAAVQAATQKMVGAFALAVASPDEPDRLIVARLGSPLVIGIGVGENFIASDVFALLPVTQRFIFLEEGDIAEIRRDAVRVLDAEGNPAERPMRESQLSVSTAEKGPTGTTCSRRSSSSPA
jgi:glutamine---fructose-6-phosphate transaminase (isomerizing)